MHYYRLTADNRLLMGGRDIALSYGANMDKDENDDIFSELEKDVVDTFPSLRGVAFTHRWGGPISATLDLSDLVLERQTDLTDVFFVNRRTIPIPPDPFRRLIAGAIRGYLRLEDRLYDPRL